MIDEKEYEKLKDVDTRSPEPCESRRQRIIHLHLIEKIVKEKNISINEFYQIVCRVTRNYDYLNAKLLAKHIGTKDFSDKQIIDIYDVLVKLD